jgi:hypothetical protein
VSKCTFECKREEIFCRIKTGKMKEEILRKQLQIERLEALLKPR